MGSKATDDPARRDPGQVLPLVGVVLMVATVAMLVVAQLGGVVVDRARARTAADAAALAGVNGGRAAAEAQARANGAVVEAWVVSDGFTQVTVRVGRARASARAQPGRSAPSPSRSIARRNARPMGRDRPEVSPRLVA